MSDFKTALDAFAPPEPSDKYLPHSLILTAMTADPKVLSSIIHRFTGKAEAQRRATGVTCAYIFLHSGASPRVSRPPSGAYVFSRKTERRGVLMHAKVALMGWTDVDTGRLSHYRILVTTGNWTAQSIEASLELTWVLDVPKGDSSGAAELAAINSFFQSAKPGALSLEDFYQVNLPELEVVLSRYSELLKATKLPSRRQANSHTGLTRFTSNLNRPLIEEIDDRLGDRRPGDGRSKQNRLVCASGFVEHVNEGELESLPVVLDRLGELKCLSPDSTKSFVFNPETAGALVKSVKTIDDQWQFHFPFDPIASGAKSTRFLHAKYILVSYQNGRWWTDSVLYLGSGNLSQAGMLSSPKNVSGRTNIEVGVVFLAAEIKAEAEARSRLFLGEVCLDVKKAPNAGNRPSPFEPETINSSPIVALLQNLVTNAVKVCWAEEGNHKGLTWERPDGKDEKIAPMAAVLDCTWRLPQLVRIQQSIDGIVTSWWVPVLDDETKMMVTEPSEYKLEYSGILDELGQFPAQPEIGGEEDDDDPGVEGPIPPPPPEGVIQGGVSIEMHYPLHAAMTLVEMIAKQNQNVRFGLFEDWLKHLHFTLLERMKPQDVEELSGLGFNFLAVLRNDRFRPPDSIMPIASERPKAYMNLIEKIEAAWGLPK